MEFGTFVMVTPLISFSGLDHCGATNAAVTIVKTLAGDYRTGKIIANVCNKPAIVLPLK